MQLTCCVPCVAVQGQFHAVVVVVGGFQVVVVVVCDVLLSGVAVAVVDSVDSTVSHAVVAAAVWM